MTNIRAAAPTLTTQLDATSSKRGPAGCPRRARGSQRRAEHRLALYTDQEGRQRELRALAGVAGSVLVVDRDRRTRSDERLVAHLCADEPSGNAALISGMYVRDVTERGGSCRKLNDGDERLEPLQACLANDGANARVAHTGPLLDSIGRRYTLEPWQGERSILQLRWCRRRTLAAPGEPISVRTALAALESYEPVCTLTRRALTCERPGLTASMSVLRTELARVQSSPIILNRGLREAVLAAVVRQRLSMSEIAIRCGRIKCDRRGNQAGETSWLARRLGLRPEAAGREPTPWIHSDVLALIARRGLGVSPREVEL